MVAHYGRTVPKPAVTSNEDPPSGCDSLGMDRPLYVFKRMIVVHDQDGRGKNNIRLKDDAVLGR
jgi:hypothetical protein